MTVLLMNLQAMLARMESQYPKKPASPKIRDENNGEGKKKNKNKKILTVDPAFADSQDKEPASSPIILPPFPPKDNSVKATTSTTSISEPFSKEKKPKTLEEEATQIITRYQAPSGCTFIHDILIYDVPAKWDNYTLLKHLSI
ncbi:hypothetical protein RclHR1_16270002 [Rhizophagus clarus]|uniref:Uncharacterized protein n=1 Tax=Rhizophagus clarus TaxID=94130 RepID=A0A2Z6RA11_9GLOM|nr:hypothetical protein RclHR1_16270002 [Rhizophagus clarus]